METPPCFIFSWHAEDDDVNDETRFVIRGFGLTTDHQNVMIEVVDFPVYLYIELPSHIPWRTSRMLLNHVQDKLMEMLGRFSIHPVKMALLYKKKLYYYSDNEFPFLFVAFACQADRSSASKIIMKNDVIVVFGKKLRIRCHEHEANGLLQFLSFKDIPSVGWVKVEGNMVLDHRTWCDQVVQCSYRHLANHPSDIVPSFNIYSFDLEVYSSDHSKMPNAKHRSDEIFQISMVGNDKKILLTLGEVSCFECQGIPVYIQTYKNEKELLLGFSEWVIKLGVHVLIGYNIFGFDIPYMMDRAKLLGIFNRFAVQGMIKNRVCKEREISWSSSAYKNQEFRFIDVIGRIVVDVLPQIKRDYKLSNYKLSTVAQHFMNADKDPVKPKDIFEFYHRYKTKPDSFAIELLSVIGEYCVQDSQLVLDLFSKLQLWIGLIEMAKACNVPIPCLYTQGQQIKVYSQIYKQCLYQKIVVESSKYHNQMNSTQYMGAFVFDPCPGIYNDIIPFDFAALYPTTIIAYNIDFSTLVTDPNIPDSDCNIVEWTEDDHKKHYKFRFIKNRKGVIPRMLEDLLKKRKETKYSMRDHDKNSVMYTVLDKRQLALKVSANSAYGIMGATKGYLPFLPGAMSTTAMGRYSITKAANHVKQAYGGQLIYGDSVCSYTPVLIRLNRRDLHIVEIEKLSDLCFDGKEYWHSSDDGKQFMELGTFVETWSERGWTRVYRIIRHQHNTQTKCIYRITTITGDVVDVTDDHSLLNSRGQIVKPSDLQIHPDVLCTNTFPDDNFVQSSYNNKTEEEAFMFGQCSSCNVPDWVLMCSNKAILLAFWKGFCISHRASIHPSTGGVRLCLNSQLLCQKVFFLIHKIDLMPIKVDIGYHCFVVDIVAKNSKPGAMIRSIQRIPYNGYVYDLTTENHHFAAGVGNLIVHNTDSIYCHFPSIPSTELWKFALKVESEFTSLFPSPMKLAFEEKIYKRFLILTKKRYMAFTQNADFSIDKNLTIRGVLLARRDNCKWIRNVYEQTVRLLMDLSKSLPSRSEVEDLIQEEVIKLCSHFYDVSHITITKSVGSEYKPKVVTGYDESTGKITDITKFKKRLEELEISIKDHNWLQLYQEKMKPAHVQLASKMASRGCPVSAGTRIEYLMIQHPNPKAKQFQKIEDPEYQKEYSDILKPDYFFVLKLAKNSLQQLISVVYNDSDMMDNIIQSHTQKAEVCGELLRLFQPRIVFS